MKIWRKRLTHSINESISDEGVYRTAPATPGLLITLTLITVVKCFNPPFPSWEVRDKHEQHLLKSFNKTDPILSIYNPNLSILIHPGLLNKLAVFLGQPHHRSIPLQSSLQVCDLSVQWLTWQHVIIFRPGPSKGQKGSSTNTVIFHSFIW